MKRVVVGGVAALVVLVVLLVVVGASANSIHPGVLSRSSALSLSPAKVTTKTVTVGKSPDGVVYDPANTEILVANSGSGTVSAVNSSTYKVTSITVGTDPITLTYSPSSGDVYALNSESESASVIDSANTVTHTVTLPGDAVGQLYDPANGDVYELTIGSSGYEISDVNHTTFKLTSVALPVGALFTAYDNATGSLVVSAGETNELTIVSSSDKTTTVTLTTGLFPTYMTYDPFNQDLYVTESGETSTGFTKTGNVSVLASDNKIVATIQTGEYPTLSTYDPDNHDIYVVDTGVPKGKTYPTSSVSVITSSNTLATTITVGKFAILATYDPKNDDMYVPCGASNLTYVIDSANAVTAKVTTKDYGAGAVYDPALGDMLVAGISSLENPNSTAKTIVTIIPSTNKGTSTVTLGPGPIEGIAYDPKDSGYWGANHGDTVSVIL